MAATFFEAIRSETTCVIRLCLHPSSNSVKLTKSVDSLTSPSRFARDHLLSASRITHHLLRFTVGFGEAGEARIARAAVGPGAQALNLFGHGSGERHCLAKDVEDVLGCELFPGVKGFVKGADDGFLDFRAAEVFGGVHEGVELELGGVASAFGEVNLKNFGAFFFGGKVHKKDFVKASFAEEFGRELRDVVGGGDDEDGRGFFGEPGEESAEDAGGRASIARTGTLRAGEGLIDFVDPKNGWGDGFGDGNGAADVFLRRADEAAEHSAHVKAQERELPLVGDGFGAEAFAAALDAEHEDALWRRQTEFAGLGSEGDGAFVEPVFQDGEAADMFEIFAGGVVFEQAAFTNDLLLFGEDFVDVIAGEALFFDDDLGENIFRFAESEAKRGLQEPVAAAIVQFDFDLLELFDVPNDLVEEFAEIFARWKRVIEDCDFLFEFGRNLHYGRNNNDGFKTVLEVEGDLFELTNDGVVGFGQKRMEIFEKENGGLDEVDDLIQSDQRVLSGRIPQFLRLNGRAGWHHARAATPFEDFLLAFPRNLDREVLDAHFLVGNNVEDGIAGADEGFEFGRKSHIGLIEPMRQKGQIFSRAE